MHYPVLLFFCCDIVGLTDACLLFVMLDIDSSLPSEVIFWKECVCVVSGFVSSSCCAGGAAARHHSVQNSRARQNHQRPAWHSTDAWPDAGEWRRRQLGT